jgi:pyridoxamine 5'-phosphate oxidase
MADMDISSGALRNERALQPLLEGDLDPSPIVQFQKWFDQAVAAQLPQPEAMTLATANAAGRPSARIVLLKGCDERGFVFYTNYTSRKGQELAENAHASLVFWWAELMRQVRIEGRVEKVASEEAEAYYATRPRGSQLGAWASPQSRVLAGRAELEHRFEELEKEYQNREVPRPPHWGGYRLIPSALEFWQGRENRLHDRLRYRRLGNEGWLVERLSP